MQKINKGKIQSPKLLHMHKDIQVFPSQTEIWLKPTPQNKHHLDQQQPIVKRIDNFKTILTVFRINNSNYQKLNSQEFIIIQNLNKSKSKVTETKIT